MLASGGDRTLPETPAVIEVVPCRSLACTFTATPSRSRSRVRASIPGRAWSCESVRPGRNRPASRESYECRLRSSTLRVEPELKKLEAVVVVVPEEVLEAAVEEIERNVGGYVDTPRDQAVRQVQQVRVRERVDENRDEEQVFGHVREGGVLL